MIKVLMVHGFMGTPNGGWRTWLMDQLARHDIYACALPMPNPNEPKKEEWLKILDIVAGGENDEVILVGHSLGVPAILQYLQGLPDGKKIKGAVLVSGPYTKLKVEKVESKLRRIDNFFEPEINFEKIKNKSEKFVVIHGDNDERVSIDHAHFISKSLNCDLVVVPNGGHLNGPSGWHTLPQALEVILDMCTLNKF